MPDGSTIVFPAGATYRLGSWGLGINGRHDLVFEGNGATIKIEGGCTQWHSGFGVGLDKPSSDITIRGFTLVGNHPNPGQFGGSCEHQHGVTVHGSTNVEISDMTIRQVRGDCLYVGEYTWSDGVYFHDSTCRSNGRMGVAIVKGQNVRIERVAFDKIAIHALDIEPNFADGGAINVDFVNNTVGTYNSCNCYGGSFFAANGDLDAPVRNVTISGNVVTGGSLWTLVGDEATGWSGGRQHRNIVFTNNRSSVTAAGPVLHFKHVDGLTITGNTQPLSSGSLVRLVDSVNVTYVP